MNIMNRLDNILHCRGGLVVALEWRFVLFVFKIFVLRYCFVPENKSSSDGLGGGVDSKCCIIS